MAQGNQSQKENLAAEAFRKYYYALHDALAQHDVASRLASELYSAAIITPETRDSVQHPYTTSLDQAIWLLQAVERSIKIDHTRLRKFTRVLEKQPVLEPLARKLHQCYRKLVSKARLSESSSSGSDTDSTEQHQSQGRGTPKDSGAGNDQVESSSVTAGIPELSMLDQCEEKAEDSGETCCNRTKRMIEDLERKYMALVEKTQKEVEKQKPDLRTFRIEITLLPNYMKEEHQQFLKDNLPQLYRAESIPEIFGLLNLCWNYLHYRLLQRIIEIYGSDKTQKSMKRYVKDVKSFQQETTLAMFWEAHPKQTSPKSLGGEIVEALTSHAEFTSDSSLKSVEEFQQKFARTISLSELATIMKVIIPGGILPGMNEIAQTLVVVRNNTAQSLEWKGYGLKLFIPSDALLPGVESCIITIRVGLSGPFQLPRHYDVISAVYDIRTTTELARPITTEIEHCAHCNSPRDSSNFTFAVADSKASPYKFELHHGGLFAPLSRYGSISIRHFSRFVILRYIGQWFFSSPSLYYCAQVYYICKQLADWRVNFVITRDLQTEYKVVSAKYRERAVDNIPFKIQFDGNEIKLGISTDLKGTTCNGWRITAPSYPSIKKEDVDRFPLEGTLCECQLFIHWESKLQEPAELQYRVDLLGAKPPKDYFDIVLDSILTEPVTLDCPGTSPLPTVPTHKDLMNKVGAVIPAKWRFVGSELGLQHDQLDAIEMEQNGTLALCFSAVFHKWECDTMPPYTWQTIITVLRAPQVGERRLAITLEGRLNTVAKQE